MKNENMSDKKNIALNIKILLILVVYGLSLIKFIHNGSR